MPGPTNPLTNPNPAQPLQSNSFDNQIYEINIDQMYQDYIQKIDSKRSYVNIIGQNTSQLLQAIGGNPEAPTSNNLVPATTFQESRCHAFFRIVGFPVCNQTMDKIYNPGHDIIYGQRSILLSDKIDIANNPISGFNALSNTREQYFLNNLTIFNTPNTIDAGVLSLSGGANPAGKRQFNSPFLINQDPFSTSVVDQSYAGVYTSIVGGGADGDSNSGNVNLAQYYDASFNTPATKTLLPIKFHLIRPFLVDPRIDFSCSPTTNRIGVPFVPNNSYLQVSSTIYAPPPVLEVVIRDRFNGSNQGTSIGDATTEFSQFIAAATNAPPDQNILEQINLAQYQQLSTNMQFLQYVNIIQAMVKKLVAAQIMISSAQSQYYWVPVPSTTGPEGGCTVQGIFLPPSTAIQTAKNIQPLFTTYDGSILIATAQSLFSQTQQNPQASAAEGQADPGGFARSFVNSSLTPSYSSSYVNNSMSTQTGLSARRQSILANASDALRIVEIIMGEFSGLGLCDIIAILASLYTMTDVDLLGFLDTDALNRMNAQFSSDFTNPGIETAMGSFCTTINQFYQLMDALYKNEAVSQGLSV